MSNFAIWCAIGFAGGIFAFSYGFVLRRRRDMVKATPRSKIRSAAMGMVEIEGVAEPCTKVFVSPFSNVEAVYCKYSVKVKRHKRADVTICDYESDEPFYVKDETGRALIEPTGADLRFKQDHKYMAGLFVGNPGDEEIIQNGLAKLGKLYPYVGGGARIECEETYILPGDPIYVLGFARTLNDEADAKKNDAAALMLGKETGQYFCISDTHEEGVLQDLNAELALCQYVAPVISVICLFFLLLN